MDTRYINKTYFISADDEGDDAITAYGPEDSGLYPSFIGRMVVIQS